MKQEMTDFFEALDELVEKAKEVKKMKPSMMSGSMGQRFWDDDDWDDDDYEDTMY